MIAFDDAGLERYLREDPGGPVVMLNLLRFVPEGGAEKYLEYVAHFASTGITERYGVEVVYGGTGSSVLVADDGQTWDAVALVRYPNRQQFVAMVRDPDYLRFEHLRTEALTASVLQATVPLPAG